MELNFSTGSVIPSGSSYGTLGFQGSTPVNLLQHQNQPPPSSVIQSSICDLSPLSMGQIQFTPMLDFSKVGRGKNSPSEEDEPSLNEEGPDDHSDPGKGKRIALWHRVKWTGSMVKLLITAVSYIDEELASEGGLLGRRKCLNLQKKGKWRTVSKVMAERGHCVSPQQCEDKFNDLNKRYKKLNDILGRGTSCQVVENPALLDLMSHLSEKTKEEVRRIMNSKHLFYEEMCSYHNCNRLHLPPDTALQRSLQLALRSRDDHETSDSVRQLSEEDDLDGETDDHEEYGDKKGLFGDSPAKRMKQGHGPEAEEFRIGSSLPMNLVEEFNMSLVSQSRNPHGDGKWMESRVVQLEQQRLQIEMEMLELERQRFKWQRFSRKKDRELEKLKAENERMRLGNKQMALQLKRMEIQMANAQ